MSDYGIELLDARGTVVAGPKDLLDLTEPFLRALTGGSRPGLGVSFLLYPIPSLDNDIAGDGFLAYRSERYGYVRIDVAAAGRIVYRHPHLVGEVVEPGVRAWLATEPRRAEVTGYRLVGPGIRAEADRPVPAVAGVTAVEPYAPGERPSFRLRPIPPPPPALRNLDSFGVPPIDPGWRGAYRTDQVKVIVDPRVRDDFNDRRRFSGEVEEGGFLIGTAYEDADQRGTWLTSIAAAVPAQHTGASFLHFTFTGDSFDHIKKTLERDYPGRQLLGWYHTHLFPARDDQGLSSIDHRLHLGTFRLPWQVAGLINLGDDDQVVRFYAKHDATLCQCPHHAPDRAPDAEAGR